MDCVRLLEEEKQETETRLLALDNELHDTHLNLDVLNHMNAGLQERVRAVERANAQLTDSFNTACLRQHQDKSRPPPSYHEANLLSMNRS